MRMKVAASIGALLLNVLYVGGLAAMWLVGSSFLPQWGDGAVFAGIVVGGVLAVLAFWPMLLGPWFVVAMLADHDDTLDAINDVWERRRR